jgi:hypothetical protein
MGTWTVEVTDTFGGEANYSWVDRYSFESNENSSDRAIMRKAKALAGLSGVRGRTYNHGDMMEFRPYGANIVMFVTLEGQ